MILKEVPLSERPREKLLEEGADKLSNAELLAIILRTGSTKHNVLTLSQEVLYLIDDITDLNDLTIEELKNINGIGDAKAITILALVELAKRMNCKHRNEFIFQKPNDLFEYFYPRMKDLKQEHLYVVFFNIKGKVIAIKKLSEGSVNAAFIDSKVIFAWAYKYQCSGLILVHNHPSGDPTPSMADFKATVELVKKSKICDFEIFDHVIIGDTYYSMRNDNKVFKVF